MARVRRAPSAVVGWSLVTLGIVCSVAAGNWWHVWQSFSASAPADSVVVVHARDRMEFWLAWVVVAALCAGSVWGLRRWAGPRS